MYDDDFSLTSIKNDDELYNAIDKLIKATTTSQERKKLSNEELFILAFERTIFEIMEKDPETKLFWILTDILFYFDLEGYDEEE